MSSQNEYINQVLILNEGHLDFKTDQIMMSKFGKKIDIIAKKQEKILMKGEGERISKAREAKKNET